MSLNNYINVFFLLTIFGIFITLQGEDLSTCESGSFSLDGNHLNKRMVGHVMLNLTRNHHECAKECMSRSACGSTNYNKNLCELNDMNSSISVQDIVHDVGFIFTDISAWPKVMVGTCGERPCEKHQLCVPTRPVATCLNIDCREPNILHSILNDSVSVYGTMVHVTCKPKYVLSGPEVIRCQADAKWSGKPVCREPSTCKEVQACNTQYTHDEHFWLFPSHFSGKRVKVYCQGMDTSEPKEYLTVDPATNFMEDRGTAQRPANIFVRFERIGIDIENMTIIQDDYTFTSQTTIESNNYSPDIVYGMAAGCKHSDHGSFSIDTSNTGVIVDKTIQWQSYGALSGPQVIDRNEDGSMITGSCGGGCAWCLPSSPLVLHFNADDVVLDQDAKTPSCG